MRLLRPLRELPERAGFMTATRRAAARAVPPLTAAAAPALTLVSASPPAGAGTMPMRASTRDGAWRLAAQAPSAPRGVPGGSRPLPQASGGSGGALPRASTSLPRANTAFPPPRHHGTLRITGSLRDGGTVRAAGLSWRPGRLPPGDRLLSFEVGYYWEACTAAGKCRTGADTAVAPFAARRYVAGHADTSRFLKVTETASEVVETDPATFSFSVKSVSVSTTAGRAVRAYPAGRPPVSEFVNGTPERRTASAEEFFSVAAPHHSAADGPAAQQYRVDQGRWRPMPASRVFYT